MNETGFPLYLRQYVRLCSKVCKRCPLLSSANITLSPSCSMAKTNTDSLWSRCESKSLPAIKSSAVISLHQFMLKDIVFIWNSEAFALYYFYFILCLLCHFWEVNIVAFSNLTAPVDGYFAWSVYFTILTLIVNWLINQTKFHNYNVMMNYTLVHYGKNGPVVYPAFTQCQLG